MRRIGLAVSLALSLLAPLAGDAQQTSKVYRVGWRECDSSDWCWKARLRDELFKG
jgi:hypothetical protein